MRWNYLKTCPDCSIFGLIIVDENTFWCINCEKEIPANKAGDLELENGII